MGIVIGNGIGSLNSSPQQKAVSVSFCTNTFVKEYISSLLENS